MPRIGSFGLSIRIKYKLEFNHVIWVAVNKHVFRKIIFTYLRITSPCSQYVVAENSKLSRTKDKESSYLSKQLLFIQIHLWRGKQTFNKKRPRTGPGREPGPILYSSLQAVNIRARVNDDSSFPWFFGTGTFSQVAGALITKLFKI